MNDIEALVKRMKEMQEAEEKRYAALTPEERAREDAEREKHEAEIAEMLKKLPGLTRISF
jgi:hypothetical protein